MIWRLATWMLLVLASTTLAGCAALDLLGGQIPGEEEEVEPAALVRPYPAPRPVEAERPQQPATPAEPAQAPAPIVSPPAKIAAESPAAAAPAAAASADLNPSQQPAAQPAAAGPNPAQEIDNATPAEAKPEQVKPAEAATAAHEQPATEAARDAAKAEPTAEERMNEVVRRRDELIAALEEEVDLRSSQQEADGELPRLQQQLRLLYLLAERPDDAVGEIDSLAPAEQEAFKQLMFGLSTWLSADEVRRPTLRNARVLRALKDASAELAAAAKLDVRNLRFCESVEGFGWYKEFPTAQFRGKQQVILYAEVDNFASQKQGPDQYETELAVSYQIFDDAGTLVDERDLPRDKEVCRNPRRDYFLAYRIYLPDGIAAGRYRLELTVEDLKSQEHYQGRKLGDGQIEFTIR